MKHLAIFWIAGIHETGGRYTTDSYQHYQFGALADYFDVELIAPVQFDSKAHGTELVDTGRVRLIPLPFAKGWVQLYLTRMPLLILAILRLFWRSRRRWDVILLIDPDLHSQIAFLTARLMAIPVVLFVGGSYNYGVILREKLSRPRGRAWRLLSRAWAGWVSSTSRILLRTTPAIVTGVQLYNEYANRNNAVGLYASSLVKDEDVDRSCLQDRSYLRGRLRLLTVCRLAPVKGLENLLDAMALTDPDSDVTLDLVGGGEPSYIDTLKRRAEGNRVSERVTFHGALPHDKTLMAMYCRADAFVLPSLSEGTPKVLFEAMAKGVPVIATAVGGIPNLVDESGCAILVPPGDARSLAGALKTLANDPDFRHEIGVRALGRVRDFTQEKQVKKMAEFLLGQCEVQRGQP